MAQTLTNSDPELDPAIAYEIALNEANTYVLGYTKDARQDPDTSRLIITIIITAHIMIFKYMKVFLNVPRKSKGPLKA